MSALCLGLFIILAALMLGHIKDEQKRLIKLSRRLERLEAATPEVLEPDEIPPGGCGRKVGGRWIWVMPDEMEKVDAAETEFKRAELDFDSALRARRAPEEGKQ